MSSSDNIRDLPLSTLVSMTQLITHILPGIPSGPKPINQPTKKFLTDYDGDIPALIPEKYFLMVNFDAL